MVSLSSDGDALIYLAMHVKHSSREGHPLFESMHVCTGLTRGQTAFTYCYALHVSSR